MDCNVSCLDYIVFCLDFFCHSLCLYHLDSVYDLWDFWTSWDLGCRMVSEDVWDDLDLLDLFFYLDFASWD